MERSDRETSGPQRTVVHVGRVVDDDVLDEDDVDAHDHVDDYDHDHDHDRDHDYDHDHDHDHDHEHVRGSRRVAPFLLVGGVAIWGAVALIRCQGTGDLPSTAVPTSEVAEPADVVGDDVVPEAAAQRPASGGPVAERTGEGDGDVVAEPAGEGWPVPVREGWAAGLVLPTSVGYTIRRGGTLENVANLFKIFHHEIRELNPGTALDTELAPNTRVVVWRGNDPGASESVGFPSAGSLVGAIPMTEGRGRRLLAIPWKTWGTAETVALLDRVLDAWAARGDVQPILVGNLSNRQGGKLEPHSTHQSGRDVDLGYPQKLAPGAELSWQEIRAENLEAAETWLLLRLLVETGAVEEIYIDRSIQKLLHAHAVAHESVPEASLAKWMEYPRPNGQAGALIKHVPGHTDHLHVRFACPPADAKCKSK